MEIKALLFLAAFVASATAVPTGARYSCAQQCGEPSKFAYERGMSYLYDYKAQTTTTNSPTDTADHAITIINAKATISVLSSCDYVLTLNDVSLEGSSHSSEFSSQLTKMPLRFAFDDGHITEVCSDHHEQAWVTNFKRGILSAFQNTMTKLDQDEELNDVDITGSCKTKYETTVTPALDQILVHRTKSSSTCNRLTSSLQTTLPVSFQRLPLLSSEQKCTQNIVRGILQETKCEENLRLRAVTGNEGGVTTSVRTDLTFIASEAGTSTADFETSRSTLAFDGNDNEDNTNGHLQIITDLLVELDKESQPSLSAKVPALFSQLVENLRHMNQWQLEILYQANSASRVRKFLIDAAPLVATTASTAIVTDLISTRRMTQEETNVWFTSLTFIPNPEVEMFSYIANIIKEQPSKEALLGVSAMVNTYCKKDIECTDKDGVKEVLSTIEFNLGSACRSTNLEEKKQILISLKALGNAGHWINSYVLKQCYTEENPMEVRVAALETFRKAPCSYDRSSIMEIYQYTTLDSELRIAAYLALMACPNQELIETIKDRLTSESVNQVGSFVWTHLSNLQESASHEKQWIRSLIGEDMLVNKFNVSSLKFSRNFESSFYMDEQGFGATMEGNVIFSSNSYLPRSGMFNLTFDLFGESINMLEVGGRLEGFEQFIEKFFGTNGYYPEETVEAILRSLRQEKKKNSATTLEDILDDITDEPEGSYYLRILGNDVTYNYFRGIDNLFEKKPDFNLVELFMEFARKGNVDYTKSYKLIDTELTYSTVCGLPLTLKLNSTATVGLRMDGHFNARSFKDLDISGHIYPSAAIQIDATMFVDAHVSKSGIKMTTNMHTSSFFDGKVKIEEGKLIDIVLNMPQEKMELVQVKSEKYFIEDDIEKREYTYVDDYSSCSDASLVLGFELCAKYAYGPYTRDVRFYILKTDTHSAYNFKFEREPNSVHFLVDTPGSTIIDRKFSVTASRTEQEVKLDVYTPSRTFTATGTHTSTDNTKSYQLQVIVDNLRTYQVSAAYQIVKEQAMIKIKPSLKIQSASSLIVDVDGTLIMDTDQHLIKIDLKNEGYLPITFKFDGSCTGNTQKLQSQIISPIFSTTVSASVRHGDMIASQLDVKYNFMYQEEQYINHYFKLQKYVTDDEKTYLSALSLQVSEAQSLNIEVKGRLKLIPERIETSASINYGNNIMSTDGLMTYNLEEGSKAYDIRLTFNSPYHGVDVLLTEKFKIRNNYILSETFVRLTPAYELRTKAEIGYTEDVEGLVRFYASVPYYEIVNEFTYNKISQKYYRGQINGNFNSKRWNFEGRYEDKSVHGSSLELLLDGQSRVDEVVANVNLFLKADDNGIIMNAESVYAGQENFAKVKATPTSINVDANFGKHVTINAKITPEGPTRSIQVTGTWDKAVDPTELEITGLITSTTVIGSFKCGEIEKSIRGELVDHGVTIEIRMEPSKIITGSLNYNIGNGVLISATLETPFTSYEKQDAMIKFRKNGNEFESQINLTWRNSQLLGFTATASLEHNYYSSYMNIDASLVSHQNLFNFERMSFKIQHSRNALNVNGIATGTIDGNEVITGKWHSNMDVEGEYKLEVMLTTPISNDFTFFMHSVCKEKSYMKIQYGAHQLLFDLQQIILENGVQIKCSITSTMTRDITALFTVKKDRPTVEIKAELNYGDQKIMATVDLENQEIENGMKYIASGRIISPFMAPIISSSSMSVINRQQFIMEFEISRFWTGYGTLKFHGNLFISPNETPSRFTASLTSPVLRANIDFSFLFKNNNVDAFIKGSYNGDELTLTTNGIIDIANKIVRISGTVLINDSVVMKVGLFFEKTMDTYTTKVNLKIGNEKYDIVHKLTYTNCMNWNNNVEINDNIHLNNIMTDVDNVYTFNLDWNIGDPSYSIKSSILADIDNINKRIEGNVNLSSVFNIAVNLESVGNVYKSQIAIGDEPNIKSLKIEISYLPEQSSIRAILAHPDWESVALEGMYKISPKTLKLILSRGSEHTTIDLTGRFDDDNKFINIRVTSTCLPYAIEFEGGHSTTSVQTNMFAVLITDKVYKGKISHTNLSRNGKLVIELGFPSNDIRFNFNYHLRQLPLHFDVTANMNENMYNINGVLHSDNLRLDVNLCEIKGQLKSSWNYETTNGNVLIQILPTSSHYENMEMNAAYNTVNKIAEMTTIYGSENVINLSGKVESNAISLECKTFFPGFEVLKASAFFDGSRFRTSISRNERSIEVDGLFNIGQSTGTLTFNVRTPYTGFEINSFGAKYSLSGEKRFSLDTVIGNQTFSLNIIYNMNTPQFLFDITTPFDEYKRFGGKANYDITSVMKKSEVQIYRNDKVIEWVLKAVTEHMGQGKIEMTISSPISGYETLNLEFDYAFRSGSYIADLHLERNSDRLVYSINLTLDSHSIIAEITSPTSDWEKITVTGNYQNEYGKLSGLLLLEMNTDTVQFEGEIDFNPTNPKVNIIITTPYASFENINIKMEYMIDQYQHAFEIYFKTESIVYSINAMSRSLYKQGETMFSIITPIADYNNIQFKAHYNFLLDIKTAEMELIHNGIRDNLTLDAQVNENNIFVKIKTPFQDFKEVTFNCDLISNSGTHIVVARLENGSNVYSMNGEINMSKEYFTIQTSVPQNLYGSLSISGGKTSTGYHLGIIKNGQHYNIVFDYKIEPYAASVRLSTPFTGYNNILLKYQYQIRHNSFSGSAKFEKDEDKFEIMSAMSYSENKASIIVNGKLPPYDTTFMLQVNYDFTSNNKVAEMSAKYNNYEQKLKMDIQYDFNSASIRLTVPFIQEELGAEYAFEINHSDSTVNASVTVIFGSNIHEFIANAKLGDNYIEILFKTPFEGYEHTHLQGSINLRNNTGQAQLSFGPHKITGEFNYSLDNMSMKLSTPFEILKTLELASIVENSNRQKMFSVSATYNEFNYGITVSYNTNNSDEIVLIETNMNDITYKFSAGAEVLDQKAFFKFHLQSPFNGYTNLRFIAKIDITNEDKAIEITMQNETDVKTIAVNVQLIGEMVDFRIRTPFAGMKNFRAYASRNRSKRSLEFSMMKDSSYGNIRASFNSLHVIIRTPYDESREISLTAEKTDDGSFNLHYKRGDTHIDLTATPTGRRRSFEIVLNSAIPGWEVLALAGRLDQDELIAYMAGQINEQKMTIQGGGTYSRIISDLNFDITTPYQNYQAVTIKLKFNSRRKELIFDAKSSSSPFQIAVKSKPNINVYIFVPNRLENTVVTADISVFNSNINIKSRFPKLRSLIIRHNVVIGRNEIEATSHIEHNGVELFDLEFKRGSENAHLKIEARRGENHSMIHFHREGFENIEFVFNRNGKEFKVEAQGTGDLPMSGSLDIVINNSFREVPRTVTVSIEIDRTAPLKIIKIEAVYPGNIVYVAMVQYHADLNNVKIGDYEIHITTPNRRASQWNNIGGSWNFEDHNNSQLEFHTERYKITATGQFGVRESNFVITCSTGHFDDIHVQYKFYRTYGSNGRTFDHYFNVGTEVRHVMLKAKGTIDGLKHAEVELGIRISRFMDHEYKMSFNLNRDETGLSGTGTFEYGQDSGTFVVNRIKRYAETRSAVFSLEATTNIPNFNHISIEGEYNFNHQAVLKLDIIWDVDTFSVNFNVHDITEARTNQTANFVIPGYGAVDITFGHDFTSRRRTFTAIARLRGQESHINAQWNRNSAFTRLNGEVDIQSLFLGHITLKGKYDVRNIHDANAEFEYNRNDDKYIRMKWVRKYTDTELKGEVTFESHFTRLPSAKILVHANFENGFNLNASIEGNDKKITFVCEISATGISAELISPIPGFEHVKGTFVYDTSNRRKKTASLRYQRGDRIINIDFELLKQSRSAGSLKFNIESPFSFIRTLSLHASWSGGVGEVHYKRNDISYDFTGSADVTTRGSAFDITFTPSGQSPIRIAFNFNAGSLISGRGTETEEIAKLVFEIMGKSVGFELKGYRNSEHLMIEVDARSSFERFSEFKFKLDSELNMQERDGLFEIKLNDFHFIMRNHFERRPRNGYYFRSLIDTTLTDLPGIVIGFGREGDECILTVGIGHDNREITIAFAPKDNFRKGFSGKLSLPRRGVINAAYDVNYSFTGENLLNINFKIELQPGKLIEGDIAYDSDGVRARLQSPITGRHNVRFRRSITNNSFFAEAVFDDYNLALQGDVMNSDRKRGIVIEADLFGRKFTLDTLLQSDGLSHVEGKFIVHTSFEGYENIGGLFTMSNVNKQIHTRAEINLPFYITPKVYFNIDLDLDDKVKGLVSVDISDQVYAVHCDLTKYVENGYEGQVKIRTPFHAASEILMAGRFKMDSLRILDTSFNLQYPMGSANVLAKYEIFPGKIYFETRLDCSTSDNHIHVMMDNVYSSNSVVSKLKINNNEITMDFNWQATSFNAKLDVQTIHLLKEISVTFSYQLQAHTDIIADLNVSVDGIAHVLQGKYALIEKDLQFNLLAQSPLIGGRHAISFKHTNPRFYFKENSSLEISYIHTEPYVLLIDFNVNNSIKTNINIDTPYGNSKFIICFKDNGEAAVIVTLLNGTHKLMGYAKREEGAKIFNLELSSPLLAYDIKYYVKFEQFTGKLFSEQIISYGKFMQKIIAGYNYTHNKAQIILDVETPLFNINKATLEAVLQIDQIIKSTVNVFFKGQTHIFNTEINTNEHSLFLMTTSPLIPGGMAKTEASISGSSIADSTLNIAFKLNEQILAAKLKLAISSMDNIYTNLEVHTPFVGYRELNFGASYVKDDTIKAVFYADEPIGFKVEMAAGKTIAGYTANLVVKTPFQDFENIAVLMTLPINKIAPKILLRLPTKEYGFDFEVDNNDFIKMISGNLNMDGNIIEGNIEIRTKAPYEFSYSYKIHKFSPKRFHILMDSSVCSMLFLCL